MELQQLNHNKNTAEYYSLGHKIDSMKNSEILERKAGLGADSSVAEATEIGGAESACQQQSRTLIQNSLPALEDVYKSKQQHQDFLFGRTGSERGGLKYLPHSQHHPFEGNDLVFITI